MKINVLCLSIWYPLSISRYFEKALRHHPDIDLRTAGPYTGEWIPWTSPQYPSGMNLPIKYAIPPDIPLPLPPSAGRISYDYVRASLPQEWKPDIVLSIDAGINWTGKPHEGLVATIATDPHVLDYAFQRQISDKFFNMQSCYSERDDIYLPYAYSQYDHYPIETEKDLDAVLVGNTYESRLQWVEELRKRGVNVVHELGVVFDEARELYNRGRIGLNWSTLNDLNARAFELPAMKLYPVMNNVPDWWEHECLHHHHIFNNLNEAVEGVVWAKENPDKAKWNAEEAYSLVQGQTYDARVNQVLRECGYA